MESNNIRKAMLFAVRRRNLSAVQNLIDTHGLYDNSGGYCLLVEAMRCRRSDVVELLLSNGAEVNFEKSHNFDPTPLHIAIENNEKELVQLLMEKGAAVNVIGSKRRCTPLYEAVYFNKIDIAELLIKYGASVNMPNIEGDTPLRVAIDRKCVELVKFLLQNGANANVSDHYKQPGFTSLHLAAAKGCKDIVELLLNFNAEVDAEFLGIGNYTSLHIAVKNGFAGVAEVLLNGNANVNCHTKDSLTPLHIATKKGSKEITELLLRKGANVNVKTAESLNENTPLHFAAHRNDIEVIEMLLNAGADINAKSHMSVTPLHLAAEIGNREIVEMLLNAGADVNAARSDFSTPLHIAMENSNIDIVEMLLSSGSNPNALLEDKRTFLHIAAQGKHTNNCDCVATVKLLLNYGVNVNAKTVDYLTPLHISIVRNCKDLVRLFLERGADVNSEDKNSLTALCRAVGNSCPVILDDILKYRPDVDNKSNQNALSIAIQQECRGETIEKLLKYGFPVKPEDATNRNIVECVITNGLVNVADDIFKHGTKTLLQSGQMPLHLAAILKQTKIAKILLKHGADVNVKDRSGRSPIHFAVENGDLYMFALFFSTLDSSVVGLSELLLLAAKSDCLEILKFLIDNGCDVNARGKNRQTALHTFCEQIYKSPSPLFPSVCLKSLYTATEIEAHMQIPDYLLRKGADINARDRNMDSPLHIAALRGLDNIVEFLLQHGAYVDSKDRFGDTPLNRCARSLSLFRSDRSRYLNVIYMLLREGGKVNSNLKMKPTPLHYALNSGLCSPEIAKLFLEYGANVNAVCEYGTPLHIAIRKRLDVELVDVLLEYGADVNVQFKEATALHLAAECDSSDVAKALLEYGADINITNKKNVTPLERARITSLNAAAPVQVDFETYPIFLHRTFNFLLDHVVKMKAAELYVSAGNLQLLETDELYKSFRLKSLLFSARFSESEKEIERMKNAKIGDSNLSYFDILAMSAQQISRLLGNDSIAQTLNLDIYRFAFPIYASMIKSKLKLGKRARELDEECRWAFFNVYLSALPVICIDRIVGYLAIEDLIMLTRACRPAYVPVF